MIEKIKEFFGFGDDEYLEDDEEDIVEDDGIDIKIEEQPKERKVSRKTEASKISNDKVVNINATTQLEVVLVKPEEFKDGSIIADHLMNRRTIVLNLESTEQKTARRLLDFLSGVAYSLGGQINRIANSTFIITPMFVDLMGDEIMGELENSGVYF